MEGLPDLEIFEKTEENGEEIYKIELKNPNINDILRYSKSEIARKRVTTTKYQICPSHVDLMKKSVNLS